MICESQIYTQQKFNNKLVLTIDRTKDVINSRNWSGRKENKSSNIPHIINGNFKRPASSLWLSTVQYLWAQFIYFLLSPFILFLGSPTGQVQPTSTSSIEGEGEDETGCTTDRLCTFKRGIFHKWRTHIFINTTD
jgi:hypothetical protein